MADIAKIGFSANTGELKSAKAALDVLKPSATGAAAGIDKFNRAAAGITVNSKGAATGIKSFEAAALGAAGGSDRLSRTALASGTAMGTVQRAAVGASASLNNLVTVTKRTGTSFAAADAHVEAYKASLLALPAAANRSSSSLARLGAAANDNINRLQSTPGNIAAQFQDIGVTAAAGMSPMLIALQQGTQLSAAMAGGVGNLFAGLRQVFSATTLLTIGLVGLIAAGLQMVDWIGVAQSLLYGMADAMEAGATAATYLGIVLLIAFAPQIISRIVSMTTSIAVGLVSALKSATLWMVTFAAANPFTAIVLAIGLVIAAMWALDDAFGGVFSNILSGVKTAVNFIIGAFVSAFNAVKATWDMLPDVLGDAAYRAADRVRRELNDLVKIKNTDTGEVTSLFNIAAPKGGNPYAGAIGKAAGIAAGEFGKAQGVDYVQGIADGIASGAGMLRRFADGLGGDPAKKDKKDRERHTLTEAEKLAKAYAEIVKNAKQRITALQTEATALGMSANAAHLYRIEQELIAQAVDKGIKLTTEQTAELKGLAAQISKGELDNEFRKILKGVEQQQRGLSDAGDQIGKYGVELEYTKQRQALMNDAVDRGVIDLDNMTEAMRLQVAMIENRAMALAQASEGNRGAQFIADSTKEFEDNMFALQRERGELGLTGAALEAYRYETDLLNDAKRQSIELTPQDIALIRQQATEYGVATEAIRKQREQLEFYRNTFKGFFTSLLDGLRQGQSAWEAFGNAVMNVVNKIIDRLLDNALDSLFNVLPKLIGAAPKIGGGGGVGGGISVRGSAFGDVFDDSGITRFAKGGAFTNAIYSSPTLFKFASGGAFGEMGEAGPEAVMPLKRGADGSLGVQVHASQPIHVVVTANDDRFNAYVDERADVRVATAAPTIANAGANVANKTAAFQQSRRISR